MLRKASILAVMLSVILIIMSGCGGGSQEQEPLLTEEIKEQIRDIASYGIENEIFDIWRFDEDEKGLISYWIVFHFDPDEEPHWETQIYSMTYTMTQETARLFDGKVKVSIGALEEIEGTSNARILGISTYDPLFETTEFEEKALSDYRKEQRN